MAKNFTNDVTQVSKLKDIAAYQEHSVVSREIIRKPSGTMTVFAFDEGEGTQLSRSYTSNSNLVSCILTRGITRHSRPSRVSFTSYCVTEPESLAGRWVVLCN